MTELSNLRLIPELMCFLFKTADDLMSHILMYSQRSPIDSGYFLRLITPLYDFHAAQINKIVDGQSVKRERDHDEVIGYDHLLFFIRFGTICLLGGIGTMISTKHSGLWNGYMGSVYTTTQN